MLSASNSNHAVNLFSTPLGSISAITREGASPLIILLHGMQGAKELFSSLLHAEFLERHELLIPDLPGWGQSTPSPRCNYSIEEFAKLVESLAQSSSQNEVIVIGHSLGAMIGTYLLASRVLNVRGLVSLEGNLRLSDCGASREIAAKTEEEFIAHHLPRMLDELVTSSSPSAKFRLESLKRAKPQALYRISHSIVEECRSDRAYKAFVESSVPRLLLIGEKSKFATRDFTGNAEVVVVPNSSHFLLHDNFDFVKSSIIGFLDRNYSR